MLVARLFGLDRVPGDAGGLAVVRCAFEVGVGNACLGEDGAFAVVEEDDVAGVVEDAGDVGGEKVFAVADADDGGRAGAGCDQLVGFARGEHADGEGSGQALDRAAYGLFKWDGGGGRGDDGLGDVGFGAGCGVCRSRGRGGAGRGGGRVGGRKVFCGDVEALRVAGADVGVAFATRVAGGAIIPGGFFELVFDEVRDDLGVGFADELVAARDQLVLERKIVFHDAVVDDNESSAAIAMRVRILFSGAAVGGPAGVTDAIGSVQRLIVQNFFQVAQFAGRTANVKAGGVGSVARDSDAGGIIAAVFQPPQAFHDEGDNRLGTDVTDDSAHMDASVDRSQPKTGNAYCGPDGEKRSGFRIGTQACLEESCNGPLRVRLRVATMVHRLLCATRTGLRYGAAGFRYAVAENTRVRWSPAPEKEVVMRRCLCILLAALGAAGFGLSTKSVGAQAAAHSTSPSLVVSGHAGQVPVVQVNGRSYVDLEALARVTNSSLAYRPGQITLTLAPPIASSEAAPQPTKPKRAFSHPFLTAAIEEMAVVREWRASLVSAVQNNYPINEDWISQYRRNADAKLALASAASSTADDQQAYALIASEFAMMQKQSDRFLTMRKNLNFIATYTLDQDPLDQQILACGRGLSALVASGQFEDVPSCR